MKKISVVYVLGNDVVNFFRPCLDPIFFGF